MAGVRGSDLLEEGAWTFAESRRLHASTRLLEDQTRDLVLTYRSHRLRVLRGGSAAHVDGLATLRGLLRSAPYEAVCDACLAFACAVSLTEMRALTEALLQIDAQFQRAATCASCRRTVPSILYK